MDPAQDFKALQEGIQKSLVSTVKAVNRVAAEDLSFQRTVNPDVAQQLDNTAARFLNLSTRLLQSAAKACNVQPPKLEDAEDIDMNWRVVVDVVDSVLEKADTAMDEYTGLVKRKDPPTTDSGSQSKKPKSTNKVVRNANIAKPQAQFELKPDNLTTGPWKPILTKKPHATVPLEESLLLCNNESGTPGYKHPYETEISQLQYPDRIYQVAEPIPYQPVDSTTATWVDTYEGVLEMLKELKKAKEIAVDLEHHDFRTYTGLVCLMQISTRGKDWIVDTLRPWRHKLEVLNEVFADPSIIKVFHGAYMDMIWLQRDLGLYVNGLFDTFFACELMYSGRSLAFLLSKFVNFDADKQYQLADWRMRPIPEEMMYYARSDTHYLLYIYDRVRNDLVEASSDRSDPETDYIGRTLAKSKELSLSRHEHPGYDEKTGEGSRGWYNYVLKYSHLAFDSTQFAVFRALWKWRDDVARKEDESPNFVLGASHIADVARVNPPDAKALHSLLPLTAPLARSRLNDIWQRIQEARAEGGPSLLQFYSSLSPESLQRRGLPRVTKEVVMLPGLEEGVVMERLDRSQLFGDMPISTRWEKSKLGSDKPDDLIPFPWQRFVQDMPGGDEAPIEGVAVTPEAEIAAEEKPAKPLPEPDTEFTLRQGRKRKSDAVEAEPSSSSEDEEEEDSEEEASDEANGVISIPDVPLTKQQIRRQSKKNKKKADKEENKEAKDAERKRIKAERRAHKLEKRKAQQAQQAQGPKFAAVPFDYSKASSVMNASRQAPGPSKPAVQKKKVFDPYSKTGDNEIKGARKAPPIRGERSATFKK